MSALAIKVCLNDCNAVKRAVKTLFPWDQASNHCNAQENFCKEINSNDTDQYLAFTTVGASPSVFPSKKYLAFTEATKLKQDTIE